MEGQTRHGPKLTNETAAVVARIGLLSLRRMTTAYPSAFPRHARTRLESRHRVRELIVPAESTPWNEPRDVVGPPSQTLTARAGVQNPTAMTANNAKCTARANAARPSKAKKQARAVASDRATDELSEEIGNALRDIDAAVNAEKEQEHPYQEQIDEITSKRLGRPLVWKAIHEPEKLLARINRTSNRKNQIDRAAQDSAAKSYDRLALIFWRIGTELAAASPEGWAEELLANPDLTLRRLEAFVKGCAQLRGDAPRGAKIERELVTLEEEPFLSAESKRRGVTVAELRREVQQAVTGGVLTLEAAGKFGRQVRKKADESKGKNALRRKST